MREMGVSWNLVRTWTQAPDQDFTRETRGWKKGVTRKHPSGIRARVVNIRGALVRDPDEYYIDALAIQQNYETRYPVDPPPSIGYIKDILHAEGLTTPHRKRRRGGAKYLCYPVQCVERLGERIAEIDFVGEKYIKGHSQPLHFLSIAYQKPPRLRKIVRTQSELTDEAIAATQATFDGLGWPDVARVDAGNPFTGRGERSDGKGARSLPRYTIFLLEHHVIPVFGAIRSPWNQAHVEGSNSVFGKNFWNQCEFGSVAQVDERLTAFNECSKKRARWQPWKRMVSKSSFTPRICFIRKVEEDARRKQGLIPVASTLIRLPKSFIGLFVFAEWHLKNEVLNIYFEREQNTTLIKKLPFPIHPSSRKRCIHFIT